MKINKNRQSEIKEFELIGVGEVFSNDNRYYYMKIDETDGWNAVDLEYGSLYRFNYCDVCYLQNAELTINI